MDNVQNCHSNIYYRVQNALHWFLFWIRPIQCVPPHPIYLILILTLVSHLRFGPSCALFLSGFPIKILWLTHPSHRPWLDHFNYTHEEDTFNFMYSQIWKTSVMFTILHFPCYVDNKGDMTLPVQYCYSTATKTWPWLRYVERKASLSW
jgi:hypothetical protein